MADAISEVKDDALLGEGPLWVANENAVYWVDIFSNRVHRYSLSDSVHKTWQFDFSVTSLAEREQGGFACTVRDGYAFIDLDAGTIDPIEMPEAHIPTNRFNDGKVDIYGRYWAGTMDENQTSESGALYCLREDLSLHKLDENYIIANGPTFNANSSIIYHTDSTKKSIYAFDLSKNGEISNKRVFVQLHDEAEGVPDGMTIDSENCIWLAHFGGARITRYSPEGIVLQVVPMPVPNITSCTFAGTNLDTLYITTAKVAIDDADLPKYPLAGNLFSYKTSVKGLPTPKFKG